MKSPSEKKFRVSLAAAVAVVVLLAGCGGGGDSEPPAGSLPAGLYNGTVGSGSTVRDHSLLILDSGRFYTFYTGPAGGTAQYLAGVFLGNGSTSGRGFSVPTARDFNLEAQLTAVGSVTSTFVPRTSITGSVTFSSGTQTFTGTYDPDYDLTPSLALVQGSYQAEVASTAGKEDVTLEIAPNGNLTASNSQCSITGSVATHASGNVYEVALIVGTGCIFAAGAHFDGHAYYRDGALIAAVPNTALTDGLVFAAFKP